MQERILKCLESQGIVLPSDFPKEDYNIVEQADFSSLKFVSLIVALEDEFDIEFPTDLLSLDLVVSAIHLFETVIKLTGSEV